MKKSDPVLQQANIFRSISPKRKVSKNKKKLLLVHSKGVSGQKILYSDYRCLGVNLKSQK